MRRRLETLWARTGKIQVSDLANNFFLARFSETADYDRAVTGGPWKIYDYYISVARWSPAFNENEPIKKIMTWVRLPKLPIQYFNNLAVTRIGDYIGKTIRLDLATSEGARGRYARVCVELDLSKPLLGKYMLEDRVLLVEYENIVNFCFGCGKYGCKTESCPTCRPVVLEKAPETQQANQKAQPAAEGDTGSWMTVVRRQKKAPAKQPINASGGSGSRFDVLPQAEEQVEDPNQQNAEKMSVTMVTQLASNNSHGHVEALARVLEETFQPAKVGHDPDKTTANQKEPLSDITNQQKKAIKANKDLKHEKEIAARSNKTKNTKTGKHQEGLAATPTMYPNPIFQSATSTPPATSGTFARIKNRLDKVSNAKSPTKTLAKVKKFKVKGGQPLPKDYPIAENVSGETSGDQPRPGEPPDPSC
ncbi:hypothetical protein LINPERHAP2_LOCUS3658 [Linum perenne]